MAAALKGLRYRRGAKTGPDAMHCTAENSPYIGRGHDKREARQDLMAQWLLASIGIKRKLKNK